LSIHPLDEGFAEIIRAAVGGPKPETQKQRLERIATAVLAGYCAQTGNEHMQEAKLANWAVVQAKALISELDKEEPK
jgi:hypothetical protein